MRRVLKTAFFILAGAALGLGAWLHFSTEPDPRALPGLHLSGDASIRAGRLFLDRGATLTLDTPAAGTARSLSAVLLLEFADRQDFTLTASGVQGRRLLLGYGMGYGDFSTQNGGILDISLEGEEIAIHFNGREQARHAIDPATIRSISLEARTSRINVSELSLVARNWEKDGPIESRVLVEEHFGPGKLRPFLVFLLVPLSILFVLAFSFFERLAIRRLAGLLTVGIESSQAFSWGVLGAGALLSGWMAAFEGAFFFSGLCFLYLRMRFFFAGTGLCKPATDARSPGILFSISLLFSASAFYHILPKSPSGTVRDAVFVGAFLLFLLGLGWIYGRLSGAGFSAGIAGLRFCAFPMALALAVRSFFPFAFLSLAWPAYAGRKTMKAAEMMIPLMFLLSLPAFEITARSCLDPVQQAPASSTRDFMPDEFLFFVPKNFFEYTTDHQKRSGLSVAALNLRGASPTLAKARDKFRILVLGGSNVWGEGIADAADTFCARLETHLNEAFAPQAFEVLNGGVPGYNSFQTMVLFTRWAYRFEPDLLVLNINQNDLSTLRGIKTLRDMLEAGEKRSQAPGMRRLLIKSAVFNFLGRRYLRLHNEFRPLAHIEDAVLVDVNSPEDERANLRDVVRKAKEQGARVAIFSEFYAFGPAKIDKGPRFLEIQELTREVAAQEKVPHFDPSEAFRKRDDLDQVVFRHDPVHLTPYGHAVLAGMLFDFLFGKGLVP